jgi:hypothetical protein
MENPWQSQAFVFCRQEQNLKRRDRKDNVNEESQSYYFSLIPIMLVDILKYFPYTPFHMEFQLMSNCCPMPCCCAACTDHCGHENEM